MSIVAMYRWDGAGFGAGLSPTHASQSPPSWGKVPFGFWCLGGVWYTILLSVVAFAAWTRPPKFKWHPDPIASATTSTLGIGVDTRAAKGCIGRW